MRRTKFAAFYALLVESWPLDKEIDRTLTAAILAVLIENEKGPERGRKKAGKPP